MNAKRLVRGLAGNVMSVGIVVLVLAVVVSAQVRTQETVQTGAATQVVTVERGEVAWVSGNDLMVKMESGELRHFPNVPESARATVGGRQLSIRELQPGMKLERTTITTTAPRTIRTVRTVSGRVWEVIVPTSVILTLDNRTNQRFKIPKDQKFINLDDGKEVDAFTLRKGMRISATVVTTSVETATETQARVAGRMPPAPPVPTNLPVMIEESAPVPVPAVAAAPAPAAEPVLSAQLPKTGSLVPLIGLLGLLSCAASFGIRILRRS